jgi:hypothetical protein
MQAADAAINAVAAKEGTRSGPAIIQHSSASVEHYGPDYIGDMTRAVFDGPIDMDPASCEEANLLIRALVIYTTQDAGHLRPWFGNVYLNPPGGRLILPDGQDVNQAAYWYAKLAYEHAIGMVDQAVFMIFNLELLRYAQAYAVKQPLEFPTCWPKDRISFWKPGPRGYPVASKSPAHPSAIVYMGPNVNQFAHVFGPGQGTWPGGAVFQGSTR